MPQTIMKTEKLIAELSFKAVRSSGPGGQNVNKVSSKVVLSFDINQSQVLTKEEKDRLLLKLEPRLTIEHILILNCDEDRSQLKNKSTIIKRFLAIIQQGLLVPKTRKPTKIPKSAIRKRMKNKKTTSEIKKFRKKPQA